MLFRQRKDQDEERVLACILAAALLTTGIPGGQAAMAQSLTETGTEMAAEETNESTSEETEAASVTETEAQTSTERDGRCGRRLGESVDRDGRDRSGRENRSGRGNRGDRRNRRDGSSRETGRLKASGAVAEEALEEDPQAGTSMSNEEPESTSNIKAHRRRTADIPEAPIYITDGTTAVIRL